MNKAFFAIVAASALVASTAGFASTYSTSSTPTDNAAGFYITGNIGYGHYNTTIFNRRGLRRNSFAWSALVGYQFNPYVALEGGYMSLPYATFRNSFGYPFKRRTYAITLAAAGIYPVNQQFNIFGKVGLAYQIQRDSGTINGVKQKIRNSNHPLTPLFALGVDYKLTQNWAIGLQGITTLKHNNNFPATYTGLVGVTYKFS